MPDWSPLVGLVRDTSDFLLTMHVRPDGDALGSALALADALEGLGKRARVVVSGSIPPRYDFLDPEKRAKSFAPGDEATYADAGAVIVLDTGTWNQLADVGPLVKSLAVPKLVIDHHVTQDDLGATRLVDTSAEATGRLVFDAIRALDVAMRPETAHRLFVALAMDTGWFRHNNTVPRTFRLAAELVELGASPTNAYEMLNEQSSLGKLRLTGVVLGRLRTEERGLVCWTEIRKDDYAACGAVPQDSEDLINFTRQVGGTEVGLMFFEQPRGGVKVSFRSRSLDVSKIAERFGGGGHRLACGATLDTSLETARDTILPVVRSAVAAAFPEAPRPE